MKLSILIPCYEEEENLPALVQSIKQAFPEGNYECVFVNDGSRDGTAEVLKALSVSEELECKVISFTRNFGKEAAVYAGLAQCEGEYISLLDADLQQRPEIARDMVKILDEQPEYDLVAAYQDRRGEGKVLSFFKKSFYKIINHLSDVNLHADASDFRTMRRTVADLSLIHI